MINLDGVVAINKDDVQAKEIFPGIRKRILWGGESGYKAQILEIDAGSKFTHLDVHEPGPEEVYVLSGVFSDGVHEYPAGTYIHNPPGSAHIPQSTDGCVLLVVFPEG